MREISVSLWTWQYIKKAGTVILAFSVILWAMMTFPGLSDDQIQSFDQNREKITAAFLENRATPEIRKKDLRADAQYLEFQNQIAYIDSLQQQTALKGSIAGWIGMKLETITRPLGFEYRTNIALLGGFAAKEVVISTLGTAYSLSDVDDVETGSLSEKLKKDPAWNPLQAFTLIIFTMLYVPCAATVVCIRKESSWKWAGFSIVFNLIVAYTVSLMIRQGGLFLGMGG